MTEKYDHKKIEKKWQAVWEASGLYSAKDNSPKPKKYVLDMFPYPSGDGLHVGHPKGYIATDVYSRTKRMQGFNVLHPMGWDAFGLPAEQYAIKNKVHPRIATDKNVARYKDQLFNIGCDYDWTREINTTDPEYYRWTQWIFLKMFEKGLAYESYEPINWCPTCLTGLANEDLEDGACERCSSPIEKKPMRQWVLRITDYADRMLSDIDKLDWPVSIKESQKNWIGRSEGAEISFPLFISNSRPNFLILHGYTGRADKNFIPWIKEELERKGYNVQTPQLPNTDNPTEEEQVGYILENCHIDKDTIIVGHSLGAIVAMKLLMRINSPVRGLVLVASAMDPVTQTTESRVFHKTFNWNIDFEFLKKNVGFRIVLSDLKEAKRINYLESLSKKLDAQIFVDFATKEHFTANEEPLVLQAILPSIKVFTTRPDTLFGATYCVLAPEHKLLDELKESISNWNEVEKYREETKARTEIERTAEGREKTGVKLEEIFAINPANNEKLPVFVADYVLGHYGTGAVMAVPAHDERDFDFANKFNLPIVIVVCPHYPAHSCPVLDSAYTGNGHLVVSGEFDGLSNEEAKKKITSHVKGRWVTKYRLKDWVFSRQRYWGEPIPLIHCEKCGVVAVPDKDLPVKLPQVDSYEPTGTGESPLAVISEWVNVKCPKCNGAGKRETNTMPQWAGSSWYYLRFIDPRNSSAPVDKEKEKYWSPVDMYVGGAEHATRHLIYARFYHKFLYDIGIVNYDEPFSRLQNVGLIMAEDGRKMSKRWGNVVNPDDIVSEYGADTLRLYEMFMGPFGQSVMWSATSIIGPHRFLERVWRLAEKIGEGSEGLDSAIHKTIKKITDDIESFSFNTAVSTLMILVNDMDKEDTISRGHYEMLLKLLAPFAPHMTEELWRNLGNEQSIHASEWPVYDKEKTIAKEITLAIQVNGKVRDTIVVSVGADEDDIKGIALARPALVKWLQGRVVEKIIVVPGRLINIVISD